MIYSLNLYSCIKLMIDTEYYTYKYIEISFTEIVNKCYKC